MPGVRAVVAYGQLWIVGYEAGLAFSDQKPPPPEVMVNETPSWLSS